MKFNFEKNLDHQEQAVKSTLGVFDNVEIKKNTTIERNFINPEIQQTDLGYAKNILNIQKINGIEEKIKKDSRIIDIMMETGTGKTYTYTKTIFELNKRSGIFKFVIVVPTLAIKSGTINFLKSESSREHFKEQYGKTLNLHIVESKKGTKTKKTTMPTSIASFVNSGSFDKNKIQVLIINAGMINSKTMDKEFDSSFFDKYSIPFEAISAVNPFVVIDEPHKFATGNTTWQNIKKMNPQFILRYGATFTEYKNLVYKLTAVQSFNRNLVKGVVGHISEFESGEKSILRFVSSDGKEAIFELSEHGKKKKFKISKKESFEKIHSVMTDLIVVDLKKSEVVLSSGLNLKRGDIINPYSYDKTLQESMIQKAVEQHFVQEREYLTRDIKIKPLTLFFIDNIEEYRNKDGNIRKVLERCIKREVNKILKIEKDKFYINYLLKTLADISKTHGGYFSKDNSDTDENIEIEVNEILHNKEALLDLDNTRRFIFSKWTLKEGWDNPNVFSICKLRGSGSEISRLQEVGRGLRLPVDEYGNRVKDEQFFLHYFVDFTESDFVEKLVNEINEKSGSFSIEDTPKKLTDEHIEKICEIYNMNKNDLLVLLDDNKIINRENNFLENGFNFIKKNYPLIFNGVGGNKIKIAGKTTGKKIKVRVEKYSELKNLWEKINEKVILEYKIDNEDTFKKLFVDFLANNKEDFLKEKIKNKKIKIDIKNGEAVQEEEISIFENQTDIISTMNYDDFLKDLSKEIKVNLKTVHNSFKESKIEINNFLNISTIRIIKDKFNKFLMLNAMNKFEIAYQRVSNSIHPTFITDKKGVIKKEIMASSIGVLKSENKVSNSYLLEELFYDSELEKENIETEITEVLVFSKIPKNSIKIPVAGGKSYSPDFAYVLNLENGDKKINFIVETKNKEEESLINEEKQKIKHAERFFGDSVDIKFTTQFSGKNMIDLIREVGEL